MMDAEQGNSSLYLFYDVGLLRSGIELKTLSPIPLRYTGPTL